MQDKKRYKAMMQFAYYQSFYKIKPAPKKPPEDVKKEQKEQKNAEPTAVKPG
jgi:hypothetical protein